MQHQQSHAKELLDVGVVFTLGDSERVIVVPDVTPFASPGVVLANVAAACANTGVSACVYGERGIHEMQSRVGGDCVTQSDECVQNIRRQAAAGPFVGGYKSLQSAQGRGDVTEEARVSIEEAAEATGFRHG